MPTISKSNIYIVAVTMDIYNQGTKRTFLTKHEGNLKTKYYNPADIAGSSYTTKDEEAANKIINKVLNQEDDLYLYGRPCKCKRGANGSDGMVKHCKAKHHICICYGEHLDKSCLGHGENQISAYDSMPDEDHPLYDCHEKGILRVVDILDKCASRSTIYRRINNKITQLNGDRRYGLIINKTEANYSENVKKANDKFNGIKHADKHCECCNKDVAYAGWSRHLKSAKHIKLAAEANKIAIKIK